MKGLRWLLVLGIAAVPLIPETARSEIVERNLGTNAKGEPVTGYVFQAGRGFNRRSSGSHRSRPVRSTRYRRSGDGIDRGYRYSHAFFVPFGSFYHRSPFSFCRLPIRTYGSGSSFSVTILR